MDNIISKEQSEVENMIYEIRGKQVMLDSDLANLYECVNGTKTINQAVKRHIDRFPERFMFQLTEDESINIWSQFGTKKRETRGGKYNKPYVFTEQGVAMLATILKSKIATEVSIWIMDAFVAMRHYINDNKDIYKSLNNINNKLAEHDEKINYIFSKFDKKEQLFLPGEIYTAYSEITDILNNSKKEIILIDAYADKSVLDLVKNVNSKIILITSNKAKITDLDIEKFNKQYNKLRVVKNNKLHDRYIIIDKNKVFHIGTSLNHADEKMCQKFLKSS